MLHAHRSHPTVVSVVPEFNYGRFQTSFGNTPGSCECAETLPRPGWAAAIPSHHQESKGATGSDENTGNHPREVGQATGWKVR